MSKLRKPKHRLSDAESRIMDRYCNRLEAQGEDKDGLAPTEPQEIASAIDAIIKGAELIATINSATVAQLALGKPVIEAGIIAGNSRQAAIQILQLTPTLKLLRDSCANRQALKKARGPKANHALRSMVSRLIDEWQEKTGMTATVTYDAYSETSESEAATYICRVTEAYFASDDDRLTPLRSEVICNQIKEYRTRASKKN
jgi:hypothetical protein